MHLTESWKEKIANKKVILYLTSVSGLLQGKEKHIEKIKRVIEYFRYQDQVVLWWRPHPLELSTINSMYPELAKEYIDIRENYEKEEIGILDTSGDLNRAIVLSDAYYGDWSSVIQIYEYTKKPILLQDDLMFSDVIRLDIVDFVVKDKELWAVLSDFPGIIKLNLDTENVEKLVSFQEGNNYKINYFNNIILNNEDILLTPGRGDKCIIFNLQNRYNYYLNLDEVTEKIKYAIECKVDDNIYLLSWCGKKILQINKNFNDNYKIKTAIEYKENLFIDRNIVVENRYIYGVKRKSNIIYKYDVEHNVLNTLTLDENTDSFMGIIKYEDFFVIPNLINYEIILWKEEKNKREVIKISPEYLTDCNIDSVQLIRVNEGIILFTNKENNILLLSIKNRAVEKYSLINEKIAFYRVKKYGEIIYAYSKNKNCLYVINNEKKEVKILNLDIRDEKTIEGLRKKNLEFCKFMYGEKKRHKEGGLINLKSFVEHIKISNLNEVEKNYTKTCGKEIHIKMINN